VEIKIIDGVITDDIIYDARFEENISLTKGQIGCSLSHINALKLALDMNVDYAFIFEDDVEIVVDTYKTLKNWLDNLPKNYDLCLLTTIGIFVDLGHDGRLHKNIVENGVRYVSCPFGTQAYYASKNIINILYDTQINMLKKTNYILLTDYISIVKKKKMYFYK
jgi:GR25 family glycosyltransferase involved in LPS biosynthesis